jgi:hypothetical protein
MYKFLGQRNIFVHKSPVSGLFRKNQGKLTSKLIILYAPQKIINYSQ